MTAATDRATAAMQKAAGEAYDSFEEATRPDDSQFIRLKDDRPDWLLDAVRAAHGRDEHGAPGLLPDDYRYHWSREAFAAIHDASEDADRDDIRADFADGGTDVYTSDLTDWLGSHDLRTGYLDDALSEWGGAVESGITLIRLAQATERGEVFDAIWTALVDRVDQEAPDDD